MFFHNLKYALKTLLKNKMLIFWTFAFPIILGTLFYFAFSNIEKSEQLKMINIAIVNNAEFKQNKMLVESFKILSDDKNEDQLFNTKYITEKEAKVLLADDEIDGYLLLNKEAKVVVSKSGINQTVFKYVVEEIIQTENIVNNLVKEELSNNYKQDLNILISKVYKEVLEMQKSEVNNIKNVSQNNLSYIMIEFYTLIAMACLYGAVFGMVTINQNLANMSTNGKRISVCPIPKRTLIFSSVIASYITQLVGIVLLFIYTIFILNVDYGDNLPLMMLLGAVGSLAGLAFGIAVATFIKSNENVKTGIIISFTMLGCFLSGMMGITMKYIIDKNVPLINQLNPASMITDGFYSLYYYDTLDRFYYNVISLLIFAFVMICLSVISLRRQKYDSI